MEFRHLRYFLAVARERNFTRASEVVGIAQPPLSRQIRQLEVELGTELFDRQSRPLKLTHAGRLVFEQATAVLQSVGRLKMLVSRLGTPDRRRFVMGFVGSTLYGPMPQMLRSFKTEAPHVDVSLLELSTLEQIAALKDGRIDIGIGRLRFDDPSIRREVVKDEPLVVALPIDHPLAQGSGRISLAQLEGETLVVYPRDSRPGYADQVLSIFRDHGIEPAQTTEVRELQTALGLVAAELGIALVPSSVQRLRRDDVIYCPLTDEGATSPVILSWRENDVSMETALMSRITKSFYRQL